jgi:hypothetical protein
MKNLFLFTIFSLMTIGAIAQEKANHNTSRSNKTTGGLAELNTDLNESEAGIFERRKCVKAGGTFYEFPNGNTKCLPARVSTKSQNMPSEVMEGSISERKKCLKSGGVWTTNSVGTFCYKRLKTSSKKS